MRWMSRLPVVWGLWLPEWCCSILVTVTVWHSCGTSMGLTNVRRANPDFVLLSHNPLEDRNQDLDDVYKLGAGVGSSAFGHVSKLGGKASGTNLRMPPYMLPDPLEDLPETRLDFVMSLFRGKDLPV
eukprot:gnl/TRDRNA2_/TRDRNA2_153540_c2_seq1.p2 gnl/TRDRNA2_/TRDRNA2_153540_c2~~gnl/TRDRNA2_/TRDRNA2_153540_c2_seq1.p2  ORF type:complete len:127 (+),score=21.43 gnl/TRDRNA2_/TRDRNA2_153540_c2_seq1:294-674(+)